MACFTVTVAEAVIVTVAAKIISSKEKKLVTENLGHESIAEKSTISFSRKLNWLSYILWGGSVLLAFEHIWHGEITPWFPFLTAASDPIATQTMLHEIATVGVSMAVLSTVVWGIICIVADIISKRATKAQTSEG